MRRTMFVSLAALTVSVGAWCGSASAQGVGVEIYAGPPVYADDYTYSEYRYGPRVYGYTRRDYQPAEVEVEVVRPSWSGGCGEFRYWSGERCVDARYRW
jgi:hypothetical protein